MGADRVLGPLVGGEPFLPLRMCLSPPFPSWFMEKQTPFSLFVFLVPSPLSSQSLPPPALNTKGLCLPLTAQGLRSPDTSPALWRSGAQGLIQSSKHQRVKATREFQMLFA